MMVESMLGSFWTILKSVNKLLLDAVHIRESALFQSALRCKRHFSKMQTAQFAQRTLECHLNIEIWPPTSFRQNRKANLA